MFENEIASIPTKSVSVSPIHCAMLEVKRNVSTLPRPMVDTAIPKASANLSRNQKAITRSRTTENDDFRQWIVHLYENTITDYKLQFHELHYACMTLKVIKPSGGMSKETRRNEN